MLPFLKNKQNSVAGLIIKNRAPDKDSESEGLDSKDQSAESAAKDLIEGIHARDAAKVAAAIKSIMSSAEAEEEKSSVEPHSYDAQNQKAAQEQE